MSQSIIDNLVEEMISSDQLTGNSLEALHLLSEEDRQIVSERARKEQIWKYVWVDPKRVSGTPCVSGTRLPVWCVLADLSAGASIDTIAYDKDEDPEVLRGLIQALAGAFNVVGMPVFPKPPDEFANAAGPR